MNDDRLPELFRPDVLRKRLLQAGVFLAAHAELERSLRDRPREFFASRWTADSGWRESPGYREHVKRLDPRGKDDALRGGIEWHKRQGVIDDSDVETLKRVTDVRNAYAHELSNIATETGPDSFEADFEALTDLLTKIERWWWFNVVMATDEMWSDVDVPAEAIMPGITNYLRIMATVALGEDDLAWSIYRRIHELHP